MTCAARYNYSGVHNNTALCDDLSLQNLERGVLPIRFKFTLHKCDNSLARDLVQWFVCFVFVDGLIDSRTDLFLLWLILSRAGWVSSEPSGFNFIRFSKKDSEYFSFVLSYVDNGGDNKGKGVMGWLVDIVRSNDSLIRCRIILRPISSWKLQHKFQKADAPSGVPMKAS